MCEIPTKVAQDETIVRAIVSPFHVDKKNRRLRPAAFRSRVGTDAVSVIRQTYKGSDFCKAKGVELGVKAAASGGRYIGLAVLRASQIREAGSDVHDSRQEYCGHAHISHGVVAPKPNEPLPPEQNLALDKKLEALRDAATFHPDPDPDGAGWAGPPL